MKKMKQIFLFSLLLGGAVFMSKCQDDTYLDDEVSNQEILQKSKPEKEKGRKKIKYKGLTVNHRFNSTENELKEKHTQKYLKKLYNKLRKKHKKIKNKGVSSKVELIDVDLPSPEAIFQASKVVINEFPYEPIEGYSLNTNDNIDGRLDIIKSDFLGFTEADIVNNNEILDEYYSQNLDYAVLDEIASNPVKYENNVLSKSASSEFFIAACTMARALKHGYGLVRSTIAYSIAGPKSNSTAKSKYSTLDRTDTRRDAFRHILWSALLAQNYFTISSKSKRLGFSNLVTTKRETSCSDGVGNPLDSREMDFHNNSIGRKIWNSNTDYYYVFGFKIGLKRPSTQKLINLAFSKVEYSSCFIIKDHPDGILFDFSIDETRSEIINTFELTAVYIRGPIVPQRIVDRTTYDYSNCDGNDLDELGFQNDNSINNLNVIANPDSSLNNSNTANLDDIDDCPIINNITTVVNGCFISKDSNYNPY